VQLKSVALDAVISQSAIPPAAGETTTLLPSAFVPVRRTALVGENEGALKLKAEVRPIGLVGFGVGAGAGVARAVGSAVAVAVAAGVALVLVLVFADGGVPGVSSGSAAAPTSVTV